MSYLQRLCRVEIAAQISLIGYALLIAAVFVMATLNSSEREITGTMTTLQTALAGCAWIALFAYLYSVGPVALVIAPIYALVEARGSINLASVAVVGSIPGAGVLLYSATPFSPPRAPVALHLACLVTGMAIAFGVYLVRTWRTPQGSAA